MFTIEHGFDATVITLIDEPGPDNVLTEDVIIHAYDDGVLVEQADENGDLLRVHLSLHQLRELQAALELPEGAYRLERPKR